MTAQRRQDHLLLAGLGAAVGLLDGRGQGVGRLGGRDDPLGAGEEHAGGEALRLLLGDRLELAGLVEVADQRAHAVVAQAAGVDRVRDEVVPQGVHLHQRRHAEGVAEVVGVGALGEAGARRRLDRAYDGGHPARPLLAQEREGEAAEVGAAAGASDEEVGGLSDHRQLQQRLLPDHGLVQQHVVEHAAEGVVGVGALRGDLDRLADRDPQRAGGVGVLGEDRPAGLGQVARARVHDAAEGLDHDPAVGLLVVRRPHLPDLALEVELRAGERQRRAPLSGSGLRRQLRDARLLVVERLRHGGVRLVRAGGRDSLVLVVDPRRRPERLLQPMGAEERRGPPQAVDVEHLARDLDVLLLRDLLHDQVHREQRRQVLGTDRLPGAGVQHRRRGRRQVVEDVVPARGQVALGEQDLVVGGRGHGPSQALGTRLVSPRPRPVGTASAGAGVRRAEALGFDRPVGSGVLTLLRCECGTLRPGLGEHGPGDREPGAGEERADQGGVAGGVAGAVGVVALADRVGQTVEPLRVAADGVARGT